MVADTAGEVGAVTAGAVVTAEVAVVMAVAAEVDTLVVVAGDISAAAAPASAVAAVIWEAAHSAGAAALAALARWVPCRAEHFAEAAWGALAHEAWRPAEHSVGTWGADFVAVQERPADSAQAARGVDHFVEAAWPALAWEAWGPDVREVHSSPVMPAWVAAAQARWGVRFPVVMPLAWGAPASPDARASVAPPGVPLQVDMAVEWVARASADGRP